MTCDDYEIWMHEEIDGELPPASQALLDAHCGGCDGCRALRDDLRALRDAAHALPEAIDPPAELWDRIDAALEHQPASGGVVPLASRRARWAPLLRLAAAACLLGGVAGVYVLREASTPPLDDPIPNGNLALVESMEAEYRAARGQFLHAIDQRSEGFAPETLNTVRENLAVIDGAVAEIRGALAEDPANVGLMELLVAARERELALFAAVFDLPDAG